MGKSGWVLSVVTETKGLRRCWRWWIRGWKFGWTWFDWGWGDVVKRRSAMFWGRKFVGEDGEMGLVVELRRSIVCLRIWMLALDVV